MIHTFVLNKSDTGFPHSLCQLHKVPQKIYVQSRLSKADAMQLLSTPSVAVVGTRRVTSYGVFATQKIVSEMCVQSSGRIPIISGFMYGVDQVAHKAALENDACTVAVLAHGFDRVPYRDSKLYEKLLKNYGIVISEYSPETPAQKWMFVERNRIIAALSEVIVVPEAAIKSGSLHTVQFGLDMGKAIAAVPGAITNPYAAGTQYLINQGAALVSSGSDVIALSQSLEKIGGGAAFLSKRLDEQTQKSDVIQVDSLENKLYKLLLVDSCSTEHVAHALAMSVPEALRKLSILEISGRVKRENGQWMVQYQPT